MRWVQAVNLVCWTVEIVHTGVAVHRTFVCHVQILREVPLQHGTRCLTYLLPRGSSRLGQINETRGPFLGEVFGHFAKENFGLWTLFCGEGWLCRGFEDMRPVLIEQCGYLEKLGLGGRRGCVARQS